MVVCGQLRNKVFSRPIFNMFLIMIMEHALVPEYCGVGHYIRDHFTQLQRWSRI